MGIESVDQWTACSAEKKECVRWVERYFKDCVCDARGEISFALGLVGLVSWGVAEIPQIITNFKTKSGHGVSLGLLLTWVIGDIFNLVGCLLEPVTLPTQFYTALLYTAATVVLLLQTIYYDYYIRWSKTRGFDASSEDDEERKPLNPEKDGPAKPISTTNSSPTTSPRIDVHYTSARSLANSGSSPYGGAPYLRTARSGPSGVGAALHCSSSEDEEQEPGYMPPKSKPRRTSSRAVGYGSTFVVGSACLPSQAKALVDVHMTLFGTHMLQETVLSDYEANPYGMLLGWTMAAIYMGGRLPQIYLNIKRGNVEGLNPLMFIFALIANSTYVGSILVRSVEWSRIKANAPWLLDAVVCVLLDLLIIIQFAYYKIMRSRINDRGDESESCMNAEKLLV